MRLSPELVSWKQMENPAQDGSTAMAPIPSNGCTNSGFAIPSRLIGDEPLPGELSRVGSKLYEPNYLLMQDWTNPDYDYWTQWD